MPDISKEIAKIQNAVYGEEVRGSIIDALEKVNNDNGQYQSIKEEVTAAAATVKQQVEAIDTKSSEVQQSINSLTGKIQSATSAGNELDTKTSAAGSAKTALDNATSAANSAENSLQQQTDTATTTGAKIQKAADDANAAATAANNAALKANTAASNADTSRTNADKAEAERVKAETARVDAEKARTSAETARNNAESSRVAAEKSRVTAETARETASKEAVDNANKAADGLTAQMEHYEQNYDALYAASITPGNITAQFKSWWKGANNGLYTKKQLLDRWFSLLPDENTYGVKLPKFTKSVSPDGELLRDSIALGVCTPSTNSVKGTDNFCIQPSFWTLRINYEIDDDGEIDVKAVDSVDDDFSLAGTAGMVGVAQKSGWFSVADDGEYVTKLYRTNRADGFIPLPECVAPDGSVRAFMVHAKYLAGVDANGLLTSATGLAPCNYSYSHNSQIALWRKRGKNYAGISVCDLNFRILMFQLKYAKKGNSGVLEGCTSYNLQHKAAVAESGVTRVLLTASQAANWLVGTNVIVGDVGTGTSTDRGIASMYKLAKNVRIKSITDVTVDGTAYKALNLDTATVFDVTTDTYISTMPWWSGSCDNVLGVDGSPTSCTNGKEPFIIQDLESQVGGYAVAADVIHVQTLNGDSTVLTLKPKTVRLAKNIASSATSNYVDCGAPADVAKPSEWTWHYIQDMGFSKDTPEFYLPSAIDGGAGSSNGCKSAVHLFPSSGSFEWLAWASLLNWGDCGLGALSLDSGLGTANWFFLAGACGSGANRGEWRG